MPHFPIQPPPDADPYYGVLEDEAWCRETEKAFSLLRFRRAMTGMAQQFFSNPANYPADQNRALECLVYNPKDPARSTLQVMAAGGKPPGGTDSSPCVIIRAPGMVFEKISTGDDDGIAFDLAHKYLTKRFKGLLKVEARTPSLETSTMLLEPFRDFLEGTKHIWMEGLQLDTFEVDSLEEMILESKEPEPWLLTRLSCTYSGRLRVERSVVSLPIKRIVIQATATTLDG